MILEDDALNALLIEDTLRLAGHEVRGSARTVPQALGLVEMGGIDAAILDLQIDNEMSFEVGRRLDQLQIPWAITTAHPRSFVGAQFSHITLLSKPFGISALLELIEKLIVDDEEVLKSQADSEIPRTG
ncbi:response regulator [Novosphingobium sp. G106]|uniref:response regulator n=1 Tax=Novosphingobium sp. G106 TaxID=2849500 RepID=UPI001C2CE04E|nr:response regulator [Novosphingobium sp. G106]MBV1692515.1 response regulator [Novosphingobium sp. G106]